MTPITATMKKFKLGLLLGGASVSKYVYEFIKWALANEHLELRAIFVRSPIQASGSSLLPDHWHEEEEDNESHRRPLAILLFKFMLVLERLLLLKNRDHYHHLHRFDLSSLLPAEMIRDPPLTIAR